jgi:hypothetical protein
MKIFPQELWVGRGAWIYDVEGAGSEKTKNMAGKMQQRSEQQTGNATPFRVLNEDIQAPLVTILIFQIHRQ